MEDDQRLQTAKSKCCWIFTQYVSKTPSQARVVLTSASLNSCMLVYALRSSERPFAASLRGIKLRSTVEEEVLVSRRFSMSTSNSPNEKQFSIESCSPSSACSPVTPTPAPRERRCWLPPLEVIPETNHPTLQSRLDRIAWTHSQENLYTPTVHPVQPLPVHTNTTDCQTPSQRPIRTPTRDSHSVSSPPNSDSTCSRKTSGLSYHSASRSLPSIHSHTTLDTLSSDPIYSRDSSTQITSSHLPSFSRSTFGSTKSHSIYSQPRSSHKRISHSVSLPPNNNSFSPPNNNSFSSPHNSFSSLNNNSFSPSNNNFFPTNNNSFSPSNNTPISTTAYLPETHTASSPSSKQSASQGATPIQNRQQSRSTNSDIISYYAHTLSTHDGSSPDSAILNSPPPSPKDEPTPDLPRIPERYLHKVSPSTHLNSRNHPQRPDSSPSMPPAKFWPYARAQQRRYNAFAQTSSPQKRLHPICSEENLQDPPHTPSKSPKSKIKSPDRSLILRGDAVLLATPGRAVLRMNMNKGNIAVVSKEGSWEQLRRGRNGRGIWGKEMDWETLLGHLRGEQGGEGKENDSRALVRVRKEWEDKMRVINEEEKKKVELGGTDVPPTPPKWQFGWI